MGERSLLAKIARLAAFTLPSAVRAHLKADTSDTTKASAIEGVFSKTISYFLCSIQMLQSIFLLMTP